jgi:cephalosporin hydroxylase
VTDRAQFDEENRARIAAMAGDTTLRALSREWFTASCRHRYSYHFSWLGLPVIQYPQDLVAMQEIIWRTRPELIVETGVARGGSLVFFASMLEMLGSAGQVVGVDIDLRRHNRTAIENHPLAARITILEGSSTDPAILEKVQRLARAVGSVLVVLDSNHTHDHVLRELELYSPLVRPGGYLIVMDTVVEDLPAELFPDRPWRPGNSPRTAVEAFLEANDRFQVDEEIENKLLVTVAPGGYLRCVREAHASR